METVRSSDGTEIAFERSGAGPPLVLVHGTAGDHTDWRVVRPALAESFTLYAIDRRGRGESGDADAYAIEREFEDVAAVVDSIDRPAFLLGHSFGAICALEAALRTDGLRKLVLYEPPIPVGEGAVASEETLERLEALVAEGDRDEALTVFLRDIAGVSQEEIDLLRGGPEWVAGTAAVHTVPREVEAVGSYRSDPDRFTTLATPTRLLIGSESPPFLREFSEVLADALPDGRLVTLPGQGHQAMNTAPEQFTRTVTELLAESPE